MKSVMIRLSLVENVNQFVNVVSRYPFEMDLRAGRHVVDAKSILGIFSLDLSRPITLDIYSDDCDKLLEEIKPFVEEGPGTTCHRSDAAFFFGLFATKSRTFPFKMLCNIRIFMVY